MHSCTYGHFSRSTRLPSISFDRTATRIVPILYLQSSIVDSRRVADSWCFRSGHNADVYLLIVRHPGLFSDWLVSIIEDGPRPSKDFRPNGVSSYDRAYEELTVNACKTLVATGPAMPFISSRVGERFILSYPRIRGTEPQILYPLCQKTIDSGCCTRPDP